VFCIYCNCALKYVDCRILVIHGYKSVACADLAACAKRVEARERISRNMTENPDFGPDGDATTPGFFKRKGE
jgi:hypothetical protein